LISDISANTGNRETRKTSSIATMAKGMLFGFGFYLQTIVDGGRRGRITVVDNS